MSKLNGFSSVSLFEKEIVAVLTPIAVGINVTINVVLVPIATEELGVGVIVNSLAFVPEIIISSTFNNALPEITRLY